MSQDALLASKPLKICNIKIDKPHVLEKDEK